MTHSTSAPGHASTPGSNASEGVPAGGSSPADHTAAPTDRREAQKQRSREQILHAAEELVNQQRSARFSVDELAERADVSRRTIFNHFATLDDILITIASDRLRSFVTHFSEVIRTAEPPVTRASVFDAAVKTLHRADLLDTIAFFARSLGTEPGVIDNTDILFHTTLTRTGDELIAEIVRASDCLDEFDAEVVVTQAISGIDTVARHWARETDTNLTPESREYFNELLARVTATWPTGTGQALR